MELVTSENATAASASASEALSGTQGFLDTLDTGKINSLLDFVRERLTSDVYGNFDLQENRLAKDGRHTKLREVVELNKLLEEATALMARKNEISAVEVAQDARKTLKPNVNQLAALRDMVKVELEKPIRDLMVENDRLRDRVVQAEKEAKKAMTEQATLKDSIRKLNSGQLKGVRSAVEEEVRRSVRDLIDQTGLKERVTEVETAVKLTAAQTESQMQALESTLIKRMAVQISDAKELAHLETEFCRQDYENDLGDVSENLFIHAS